MLSLLEVGGSLLERAAVGNPLSLLLAASAFALSLGYLFQLGYRRHVGAGRTVGAGDAGSGRYVRLPRAGRVGARPRPPVRHRAERPLKAAGRGRGQRLPVSALCPLLSERVGGIASWPRWFEKQPCLPVKRRLSSEVAFFTKDLEQSVCVSLVWLNAVLCYSEENSMFAFLSSAEPPSSHPLKHPVPRTCHSVWKEPY